MAEERSGARRPTLEEWKALCAARDRAQTEERDAPLLGGSWASGTITPPPSREDPRARVPLERAEEEREKARSAEGPSRREACLRAAAEWLRHPFPGASPELRTAMRRMREEVEAEMDAL